MILSSYIILLLCEGDVNSGKSTLARNLISNLNEMTNIASLENKKIHLYYCYSGVAGKDLLKSKLITFFTRIYQ